MPADAPSRANPDRTASKAVPAAIPVSAMTPTRTIVGRSARSDGLTGDWANRADRRAQGGSRRLPAKRDAPRTHRADRLTEEPRQDDADDRVGGTGRDPPRNRHSHVRWHGQLRVPDGRDPRRAPHQDDRERDVGSKANGHDPPRRRPGIGGVDRRRLTAQSVGGDPSDDLEFGECREQAAADEPADDDHQRQDDQDDEIADAPTERDVLEQRGDDIRQPDRGRQDDDRGDHEQPAPTDEEAREREGPGRRPIEHGQERAGEGRSEAHGAGDGEARPGASSSRRRRAASTLAISSP